MMIETDETIGIIGMIGNEEMIEGMIETPGPILSGIQKIQGTRLLAILLHLIRDSQDMTVLIVEIMNTLPNIPAIVALDILLLFITLPWTPITHNIKATASLLIPHSMEAVQVRNSHLMELLEIYLPPDFPKFLRLVMANLDTRTLELLALLLPPDILPLLVKAGLSHNPGTFCRITIIWSCKLTTN
jgi:hypothetical protein